MNPAIQRIFIEHGESVFLFAAIRDQASGDLITTSTSHSGVLVDDCGTETSIEMTSSPVLATPEGTEADPNPNWNTAVNGPDGYNFKAFVPADLLVDREFFEARFEIESSGQKFRVTFEISVRASVS